MDSTFDRCLCTPNARVMISDGQVFCTRCLSARDLLPPSKQCQALGILGCFYAPKEPLPWTLGGHYSTSECSPGGACWLSAIFPLARMTSGNFNFMTRLRVVADALYRDGALTPRTLDSLQVYDRGCNWYKIVGPVPGVCLYANSHHVSDRHFPGATHVLTNLPLPQQVVRGNIPPFQTARTTSYEYGKYVVYILGRKYMYAPRGQVERHLEPLPEHVRNIAEFLIRNFPPHHPIDPTEWDMATTGFGYSFSLSQAEGQLDINFGLCWTRCFSALPDAQVEEERRLASSLGYQTKHGVPGKYLQRRLHARGLRAVRDPSGPLQVTALAEYTSYIRHIEPTGPLTPGFLLLDRIAIVRSTEPTELQIFRFGNHKWYGRKKSKNAPPKIALEPSMRTLTFYTPPADGSCGWHCISAIMNHMTGGPLKSTLPTTARPSDDWATDEDLTTMIEVLRLPAGIDRGSQCPVVKYHISLDDDHWTLHCIPAMDNRHPSPECVEGVCDRQNCTTTDCGNVGTADKAALLDCIGLASCQIPSAVAKLTGRVDGAHHWTVYRLRHTEGDHLKDATALTDIFRSCFAEAAEEVDDHVDAYIRGLDLEQVMAALKGVRVSHGSSADLAATFTRTTEPEEAVNTYRPGEAVNTQCMALVPATSSSVSYNYYGHKEVELSLSTLTSGLLGRDNTDWTYIRRIHDQLATMAWVCHPYPTWFYDYLKIIDHYLDGKVRQSGTPQRAIEMLRVFSEDVGSLTGMYPIPKPPAAPKQDKAPQPAPRREKQEARPRPPPHNRLVWVSSDECVAFRQPDDVPDSWDDEAVPLDLSDRSSRNSSQKCLNLRPIAAVIAPPPPTPRLQKAKVESAKRDVICAAEIVRSLAAQTTPKESKTADQWSEDPTHVGAKVAALKANLMDRLVRAHDPSLMDHPAINIWLTKVWQLVNEEVASAESWEIIKKLNSQFGRVNYWLTRIPPPRHLSPTRSSSWETISVHSTSSEDSITSQSESKDPAPTPKQNEDQQPNVPADPPKDPPDPGVKQRLGRAFHNAFDALSQRVFQVFSHLPATASMLLKRHGGYNAREYAFAGFCLFCLLMAYYVRIFAIFPLVGCFMGSSRLTKLAVYSVWMGFAVLLFAVDTEESPLDCGSDPGECRRRLEYYVDQQPWRVVRGVVVGPVGLATAIFGQLLGGSRYIWFCLLRLSVAFDLLACVIYVVFQGRCKKCWGLCVRTAPAEVVMKIFPLTRCSKSSLIDLCDRYCSPKLVDPIKLATGWSGCWTGNTPIEVACSKPISYCNLDEKKIGPQTVVSAPLDPTQGVKCLKVLQAGGAIVSVAAPKVIKVEEVPFLAPFFPKTKVNPEAHIVVDVPTYTAALRCGYDVSQLILGEGDFAKANGLAPSGPLPNSGGFGRVSACLHCAIWVCAHMIVGAYVTSPGTCGLDTNDPWCRNPFSRPVLRQGEVCSMDLCISAGGLSLPLQSVLSSLGITEWASIVLIITSLLALGHRYAVQADIIQVMACILCYTFPALSWVACLFPLELKWVSLHPLTVVWSSAFLVFVSPAAGVVSIILLVAAWVLGRTTNVCGLVTPYDIHSYTTSPRSVASLAGAPDGTYLAAVRRAALSGRTCMFVASGLGSVLEGALRTATCSKNTVTVIGGSTGSGGVFTIGGQKIVLTATHVLNRDVARVVGDNYSSMVKFTVRGDFAYAALPDWKGAAPNAEYKKTTGKAFWLTSSGVEPGVVGDGYALCFTNHGDSGSPVVDECGNIIGVHTGSNKNGGGLITYPDGTTTELANVKLSQLAKHFGGPQVPITGIPISKHITADVDTIPSDLATLLATSKTAEGGLGTVQLLCVFFLLWRMMSLAWTPVAAIAFFVLNEILPGVLVRGVFSFAMFAISWYTPWASQVMMVRLLTAALNRNPYSLAFYVFGALVAVLTEATLSPLTSWTRIVANTTWAFIPRQIAFATITPISVCGMVHAFAIVLWIFKRRALFQCLVGDGVFDKAFFLKYFAEGKLRQGVSQSCGFTTESLTAALAINLSEEDLAFLQRLTDFKCFVSASNMLNAANQYIETAYAKALRMELASLVHVEKVKTVLAKLEAFADTVSPSLGLGDVCVVLGHHAPGDVLNIKVGKSEHTILVKETRVVAGTRMTIGEVIPDAVKVAPLPVGVSLENGPSAGGRRARRQEKERFASSWRKSRRPEDTEHLGQVEVNGVVYDKFWDKRTGNCVYVHYEGMRNPEPPEDILAVLKLGRIVGYESHLGVECVRIVYDGVTHLFDYDQVKHLLAEGSKKTACLESAKLGVQQALANMGQDEKLSKKELEKLQRIIEQLQGLCQEQALNY